MTKMLDRFSCSLLLKGPCNYSCYYCVGGFDKPSRMDIKPMLHNLDVVKGHYETFQGAAKTVHTTFFMPGTEPPLHPQFCQLLGIVLDAGTAMLRTNLSIPISEWRPHKPGALTLQVTLHPPAEEDLAGFTARALEVMEAEVGIVVYYLNHPYQAHKLEGYREHFASAGVPFQERAFQGEWEGRQYPLKKTEIEKSSMKVWPATSGEPKMCAAGWNYAFVGPGSELRRCPHFPTRLGKLLDGPAICQKPGNCPGHK